ncbi:hypothetical protein ACLX1H_000948 [Fusarium chlamydosporum]
MRAFVTDGNGRGSIQETIRPATRDSEILVRIHYVALNPGDWKLVEGNVLQGPAPPGLIAGCDFAGTVEEPNGSRWQKGQRVSGWVRGATFEGIGSFAEFIAIEATLVFAIPDNIRLQQASTIPAAFATATQAMFQHLKLPEPYQINTEGSQIQFLVYGASTSAGQYAVQLGRLSGLRVIALASKANHDLLKRMGADFTLDYHDENWVERVKKITGGKLQYALDNIANGNSSEKVASALMRSEGARMIALSPVGKGLIHAINPYIDAKFMVAFTAFGKPLGEGYAIFEGAGDAIPEHKAAWKKYLQLVTKMLENGELEPNPVREVGTLDNVFEAFQLSKEGKLSAEKAVLK